MKTDHDIKLGVSLYSYQDNYYFKKHDLEGCIAAVAGSGAEGFEIFPESMIPEWPYISDRFIDWFVESKFATTLNVSVWIIFPTPDVETVI